jgi:hypothetical protein
MARTITVLVLVASLGRYAAAADPKFEFGKVEEVKLPDPKKRDIWKASAQLGLILNTGNSNNVSFAAGGNGSWRRDIHRLTLDVNGAYAQATILQANDVNGNGVLDDESEIGRVEQRSTALWNTKLRYDVFFTKNNLAYISGFAWGNEPAGKRVVAGTQAGYARQLYKSEVHALLAEAGYDFSYESLTAPNTPDFNIHSLRLFVSYGLSISTAVVLNAELEYLGNLNPFRGPYNADVSAFEDSRIYAKTGLTAKLYKWISFRFGFIVRYDNVPAPRPALGVPYAMGFIPPAEKVDTITDASLVVTYQ